MSLKKDLAEKILSHQEKLQAWYEAQAAQTPPPFYCSVDLRDSGYKIVPVDSNLFPAGFNNICHVDQRNAPPILRQQVEKLFARLGRSIPGKVLILPESHTHNQYYIENLYYLREMFLQAGFEVQVGWFSSEAAAPVKLVSVSGKELTALPIQVQAGILSAGDFIPEMILLNNDFSAGYPKILDGLKQPVVPNHALGWHSRKKSEHFRHYNSLAKEFAQIIGVDPWIFQVDTHSVDHVNFNEETGTDQVATHVEEMLKKLREDFSRHGIKKEPFVFVKNNAGTYGMGIMVVHNADEIRTMNRRTKNKMSVGKNRQQIDSVVIQEGVPTAAKIEKVTAEPVIYLVGCDLIGGFLRTNSKRGVEENLNSEGMVFRKLCVSDLRDLSHLEFNWEDADAEELSSTQPILELVYGSVARLSALAAGRELSESKAQSPQPLTSTMTTVTSSA